MKDVNTNSLSPDLLATIQDQVDSGLYEGKAIEDLPLAKFHNATPYPTQYFQSVDCKGVIKHVIVLRITYDMNTIVDGEVRPAAFQTELQTQDWWRGEVNDSSPVSESDIVPFKPRCDVLVINAVSKPLGAQRQQAQQRRWRCGISLYWSDAEGHKQEWKKILTVTGPRTFTKGGLQQPELCDGVAIDWSNAFGGQYKLPAEDQFDNQGVLVQKAGEKRWQTDERNPVGKGFDKSAGSAAPQLEVEGQPYLASRSQTQYPPMGLSATGKAWLPRRLLAGTYDDDWLQNQWPLPPDDFDEGYWNCAPQDQQLPHLPAGVEIRCAGLFSPLATPTLAEQTGVWAARLPRYQPQVNVRHTDIPGAGDNEPMVMDTLILDWESMQIYAVYRFRTPASVFSDNLQLVSFITHADKPDTPIAANNLITNP